MTEAARTVEQVIALIVTSVSNDLGQQAADLRAVVERFVETTEGIAA